MANHILGSWNCIELAVFRDPVMCIPNKDGKHKKPRCSESVAVEISFNNSTTIISVLNNN